MPKGLYLLREPGTPEHYSEYLWRLFRVCSERSGLDPGQQGRYAPIRLIHVSESEPLLFGEMLLPLLVLPWPL